MRTVAEYDVDSTGKVLDFKFTPTRDGGYNRRLDEVLRSFKFRPGTKPDGTPIRMKAQIIYDFALCYRLRTLPRAPQCGQTASRTTRLSASKKSSTGVAGSSFGAGGSIGVSAIFSYFLRQGFPLRM